MRIHVPPLLSENNNHAHISSKARSKLDRKAKNVVKGKHQYDANVLHVSGNQSDWTYT